jgi:hypothetical protein
MIPARFFQPDQAVPLNWLTNIVFVKLRAAQTAVPLVGDAHDASELTVFVPSETNGPQAAAAGCACTSNVSTLRARARWILIVANSFTLWI